MEYIFHIGILIAIYTILAQSLSLVAGYCGQISLAHAGFFGIGAYVTALLSIHFGLPIVVTMPIAIILSALIAYIVSFVAAHTIDDYYIIITLGIQVIIYSLMNNLSITNGRIGIENIPQIDFFGDNNFHFFILAAVFCGLIWWFLYKITHSSYGKMLIAISEDEVYSSSIGKDVTKTKIQTFVISGSLASIAGVLYAHYSKYIDPTSFTVNDSIFILSLTVLGGMRNLLGIFIATLAFLVLPEILRTLGSAASFVGHIQQIIYGFCLVFVIALKVLKINILKTIRIKLLNF